MLILGLILLVIGFIASMAILETIGIITLVIVWVTPVRVAIGADDPPRQEGVYYTVPEK